MTGGGAEIIFGGHEKLIYVNSRGGRGHAKFIPVRIELGEDQKKILVIVPKFLRILHEFLSEDQKKKGLRPKSFMKSGVSHIR